MTILCIIGPSGSGKTTLAEALVPAGINTIRSYTTRPMRPGEQNGRDHIFIDDADACRLLTVRRPLAYTRFGGYRYFALWEQLGLSPASEGSSRRLANDHSHILSYVIDEAGYHTIMSEVTYGSDYMKVNFAIDLPHIDLLPIRIERSEADLAATIDPARRRRDEGREAYDGIISYGITINNDAPDAIDLITWAQKQLAPALTLWISHGTNTAASQVHLSTHMCMAEIIASLNGAI